MPVVLRAATVNDVAAVLALWDRAGSVASMGANEAGLHRLIAHDPDALIVAVDDAGAVVGSVIAGFDGWRGAIHRLAVDPTHRRAGLARALVAAADDRLRALGCPRSAAIVLEDRPAAMGFWSSSGYEHQRGVARFVRRL